MKTLENMFTKAGYVMRVCLVVLGALLFVQHHPVPAQSGGANVLFILDGSGSMWARLEGDVEKIVIAKERMSELVRELPENINIGLMVYGHRSKGDCNDIELLTPLGAGNRDTIIKQIQAINPKGKTPITKSIELAAQQLETIEEETEIVLVSDGEETCEGDPCAYVKTLKDKGIKFRLDVVGFDVNEAQKAQLSCIAEAGGGRYFTAKNTIQLKEAFTEVKAEVMKKPPTPIIPKVSETLWLDTYSPRNVDYSGPVRSSAILEKDVSYLITIEGTFSFWPAKDTRRFCTGAPEKEPLYPSPNTQNGQVSGDVANLFANPSAWSPGCKEKVPRPVRQLYFSLDGGKEWSAAEPLNPKFNREHRYTYKVIGEGHSLQIVFSDKPVSDNFGRFKIQIQKECKKMMPVL